jgi:cytochrome b subunit of formate dehydrogenase
VATVDAPVRDEGATLQQKTRPAVVVAGARTHFRRFTPFQRWVHFFIMISFSTLVLTGMPLKYSDKAWAETWMGLIGGLENAGMIHRFAAIIMVLCGICMIGLFLKVLVQFKGRYWGPGTMVPTWQDYRDLKAMVSWFIGRSPRPHLQLDRYAYYEKGEFWAATGGCSIMIVTGAILWYPEVASRFLPGIVINFALVNHSGGALLAMGFVVVFWHFFHAHLRPEAFPMDKAMYAGGLPLEEYAHERPVEYERLVKQGKLDDLLIAPVSERHMKLQSILWWVITGCALTLWVVFCIFVIWVTYNWLIGF